MIHLLGIAGLDKSCLGTTEELVGMMVEAVEESKTTDLDTRTEATKSFAMAGNFSCHFRTIAIRN